MRAQAYANENKWKVKENDEEGKKKKGTKWSQVEKEWLRPRQSPEVNFKNSITSGHFEN